MRISIIIPAYNEAGSIGGLVTELRSLLPEAEIIVVNDGSSDDTAAVAAGAGARVQSHPYNIGNGAAVKTGIRTASGDLLVLMDGDGQHDPREILTMLSYFPDYDMVVGRRGKGGQASLGRALGNRVFNLMASYVAKFRVEDLTSGFRIVKADIARRFLSLLPNTYSYPTTMTLSVLRSGNSLKYVPIETRRREKGTSQIKFIRDGIRFFMIIIRICTLYSPLRIFLPVSAALFCVGAVYYLYTYLMAGRFTNMSALLFSTSIIIFMMGLVSEQVCQMRYERHETAAIRDGGRGLR